jgi:protein gp37
MKMDKSRPTTTNHKFNPANDSISWAKWTWNPVTGCKKGCPYCYAKDIASRFYPEGFKPTFRPERLDAPAGTRIPRKRINEPGIRNVFTCSMGELFGDWVPEEWIDAVFESISKNPQWNFILLTKNPERYLNLEFPKNVWIGATADTQERANTALRVFYQLKAIKEVQNVLFLSCEPLLEPVVISRHIEWLIIGGRSKNTQGPASQPEWKWVLNLTLQAKEFGIPCYWKPNLKVRPEEYPE